VFVNITYIGHATVLVDTGSCKFITDPLLVRRIAWIGPKRKVPLQIQSGSLDDIDFITISHGHFDHLDLRSLKMIHQDVPVVCHPSLQRIVRKTKHKPRPLGWWESTDINGIKITAVPAFHFSARPPFHFSVDYQGYIIEAEKTFYHAGDGGMNAWYKEVGKRFKTNIAFLPIGGYHPPSYRKLHLSPEDALDALVIMNADLLIPIHWGTFILSREPIDEPSKRLLEYAEKKGLQYRIKVIQPGDHIEFCQE
jgi:L-ascorbate metabolism protein UlaG (beta-lactamase superfamily)